MNLSEKQASSGPVDAIVLGAGIAGLAAAQALCATGRKILVIDAATVCGGAHRSRAIGDYTFDVGSIFFETTAPIFTLCPNLRARCLSVRRRQQRITPGGALAHYPFEPQEILSWPMRARLAVARDLLLRGFRRGTPETVEDMCQARIGDTIYTASGLKAYITHFHQESPQGISAAFFYKRMGFIEKAAEPKALLSQVWRMLWRRQALGGRTPLLVRPAGGFSEIYDPIRQHLEAEGIRFVLGHDIAHIRRRNKAFEVRVGESLLFADQIVSAIPIKDLHQLVFGERLEIESLDLLTLFVSCPKGGPVSGNVLFNFHGAGRWKRLTMYSDIYGECVEAGLNRERDFFSIEITARQDETLDPDEAFADFARHVTGLKLFPSCLTLEGFEVVRNAYPVYRPHTGATIAVALDRLAAMGIVSVGRQGRFEYLPTSTLVIRRTHEELARHLTPLSKPLSERTR